MRFAEGIKKVFKDESGIQTIETLVIAAMGAAIAILGISFLRSGGTAAGGSISTKATSAVTNAGATSTW